MTAPLAADDDHHRLEVIAAQMEAVITSAPFGIGLFDREVRHVRVNPVLEEMNGLPAAQLLGRTPAQLHPGVGDAAEEMYRQVMSSGQPRRDVLMTGAVGSRPDDVRHWNASFFPVRHAETVIGLCVIVADVTTEHRLAAALAESEEQHRRLAQDLQSSLLPPRLPAPAGVDLAALYRPAQAMSAVGGDFYDLVELDGSSWLLVIGDVEGSGPVAASLTAAVRYAIRAAAIRTTDPAEVLHTANAVLLRQGAPNGTCTAVCVLAERAGDQIRLRYASAGHPLPLVRRAGTGAVDELGTPGPLMGALDDLHPPVHTSTLRAGDVLLLYTDGATEARCHTGTGTIEMFGEDRLRALLATAGAASAADIAERIQAGVLDFQAGQPADDVAVLVLRATGSS
ncbi:PP2C family protein-serine/threonine phosphatase [Geodermatophilus marinus]|uniref:PP2C family protein-serine/threonine phosphatase n=1 Tax=Geodermatophilus sp. LHW52908 TaxID=2303986 RepID=UPI000E3CF7A3|nr:SpoIIE family protein phosphatase [Geodermatophilus sp. LHW52908]RFU23213.1 PAS domain S-box protein [Geodermatophilus sp. LHW52908]